MALDNQPTSDFLYYLLALCLLETCRPDDFESMTRIKSMFMKAAELSPSSRSWLGVAKACTLLGEHGNAEEALLVFLAL